MYACMHMYVCMYACMYACMYVCMYVCVCIYVSICIYLSVYICIFVYIYLFIYIYIYLFIYLLFVYVCVCHHVLDSIINGGSHAYTQAAAKIQSTMIVSANTISEKGFPVDESNCPAMLKSPSRLVLKTRLATLTHHFPTAFQTSFWQSSSQCRASYLGRPSVNLYLIVRSTS